MILFIKSHCRLFLFFFIKFLKFFHNVIESSFVNIRIKFPYRIPSGLFDDHLETLLQSAKRLPTETKENCNVGCKYCTVLGYDAIEATMDEKREWCLQVKNAKVSDGTYHEFE